MFVGIVERGLKCCVTDGVGCDECPYKRLDKPDCMQKLIDHADYTLKSKNAQIKELEEDLRRARWGTNYNRF